MSGINVFEVNDAQLIFEAGAFHDDVEYLMAARSLFEVALARLQEMGAAFG